MDENLSANNIENDDSKLHSEDRDYNNLINKLKEIQTKIVLLQETIFK